MTWKNLMVLALAVIVIPTVGFVLYNQFYSLNLTAQISIIQDAESSLITIKVKNTGGAEIVVPLVAVMGMDGNEEAYRFSFSTEDPIPPGGVFSKAVRLSRVSFYREAESNLCFDWIGDAVVYGGRLFLSAGNEVIVLDAETLELEGNVSILGVDRGILVRRLDDYLPWTEECLSGESPSKYVQTMNDSLTALSEAYAIFTAETGIKAETIEDYMDWGWSLMNEASRLLVELHDFRSRLDKLPPFEAAGEANSFAARLEAFCSEMYLSEDSYVSQTEDVMEDAYSLDASLYVTVYNVSQSASLLYTGFQNLYFGFADALEMGALIIRDLVVDETNGVVYVITEESTWSKGTHIGFYVIDPNTLQLRWLMCTESYPDIGSRIDAVCHEGYLYVGMTTRYDPAKEFYIGRLEKYEVSPNRMTLVKNITFNPVEVYNSYTDKTELRSALVFPICVFKDTLICEYEGWIYEYERPGRQIAKFDLDTLSILDAIESGGECYGAGKLWRVHCASPPEQLPDEPWRLFVDALDLETFTSSGFLTYLLGNYSNLQVDGLWFSDDRLVAHINDYVVAAQINDCEFWETNRSILAVIDPFNFAAFKNVVSPYYLNGYGEIEPSETIVIHGKAVFVFINGRIVRYSWTLTPVFRSGETYTFTVSAMDVRGNILTKEVDVTCRTVAGPND